MRVAVCVSGQMRAYRECSALLSKNIIEPLNADVFVHTWSGSGLSTKLIMYISHDLHPFFPREFAWDVVDLVRPNGPSRLEAVLPTLYKLIREISTAALPVTPESIVKAYSPRTYCIEDFNIGKLSPGFDLEYINRVHLTGTNSIPMFYKIWACDQLRRQAEEEDGQPYDVVIRIRPDFMVHGQLPAEALDVQGSLSSLHNPFYDAEGVTESAFDAFAIGDSSSMTVYADTWLELPNYLDPHNFPEWPFHNRGPERVLYKQLTKIGAEDNRFRPDFLVYPNIPTLSREIVLSAMLEDLEKNEEYASLYETISQLQAQSEVN